MLTTEIDVKLNSRRVALATVAVLAVSGVTGGVAAAGEDGSDRGRERGRPDCSSTSRRGRAGLLAVVGLTADGRLICFNEYEPSDARSIGRVVGLTGDSALVGIDYRPASGELVGLGDAGGVYSIDSTSGSATKKSQHSVTLTGTSFGVDFNPTVDRLRITSDGQNLRANVDTGATLVAAALDPDAWEAIFRRCHGPLFSYARRRTPTPQAADDAVSETMIRALERIDRFRWRAGGRGPAVQHPPQRRARAPRCARRPTRRSASERRRTPSATRRTSGQRDRSGAIRHAPRNLACPIGRWAPRQPVSLS